MNIKKIMEFKNIGRDKLILLGVAGILFVGASYFESGDNKKISNEIITANTNCVEDYKNKTEDEICRLLENLDGVSKVSVMISLKSGSEKILKEDSEMSGANKTNKDEQENTKNIKKSTVVLEQDGNHNPYIIKEIYPEIEGIAVTAKGISNNQRKEEVINMLMALFDVPVHKISILEVG